MATTPNRPQPDSPIADVIAQYNQNFDAVDDQDRTKIIRNGSVPTLLLGYQKDGFGTGVDYGLKVAKPGKDVTTATAADLAFNSGYDHLKVVSTGTATVHVTAGASDGTTFQTSVTHSLGYTPAVIAYLYSPRFTTYNQLPYDVKVYSSTVSSLVTQETYYTDVTSSAVRFLVQWGHMPLVVNDHDVTFKYYLLQETAN